MSAIAIIIAIPVFFLLIGLEYGVSRWLRKPVYRFQDAISSLDCGVVQQATSIFAKGATIGAYAWIHAHYAIFDIQPSSLLAWVVLFFGVDLAYYWFHRESHRINVLWATHVVHHSSEEYNLTTALRQGAIQTFGSAAFYWPLAILGFPPEMFVAMSTANTLYQFWIHTRLIGKLGPLEWVLNTPSHHRVHHGIDPEYIDKNYAGILIIWDRMFGTFVEEKAEPNYGTVKPLSSWSPLWANIDVFARLWEISRATRRWQDKLWIWIAPPEWMPDDHGGTVTIPEVNRAERALYDQPGNPLLHAYVAVQFAVIGAAVAVLLGMSGGDASPLLLAALSSWIVASTVAWSGLFERKSWAVPLEVARLLAFAPLAFWAIGSTGVVVATVMLAVASLAIVALIARMRSGVAIA